LKRTSYMAALILILFACNFALVVLHVADMRLVRLGSSSPILLCLHDLLYAILAALDALRRVGSFTQGFKPTRDGVGSVERLATEESRPADCHTNAQP
jgi:hypothetical protein